MAERLVIFNADDLGISPGTNDGIQAAVEAGLVREASLCVTGIAAEAGAAMAARLGERLRVGLHLSLTLGAARTGAIRGLTDTAGSFAPLPHVLRSCLARRVDGAAVEAEIRAQLAALRALGIEPTHLNGHHHVHTFPVVRDALLRVLKDDPISYIRLPNESARTAPRLAPRRLLLGHFARRLGRSLRRLRQPPRSLPMVGLALLDEPDYRTRFLRTAGTLRCATEWMLHPRAADADFARLDHHTAGAYTHHQEELATLADPAFVEQVRGLGIRPGRYSELDGAQAG